MRPAPGGGICSWHRPASNTVLSINFYRYSGDETTRFGTRIDSREISRNIRYFASIIATRIATAYIFFISLPKDYALDF